MFCGTLRNVTCSNMVEHVFLNKAQHSGHLGSLWFSSVNTVVHSCLKVLNWVTTVLFRSTTVIFGATTVVFGSNTVAYGTMKWHLWKFSVWYLGIIQGCFGHTQWYFGAKTVEFWSNRLVLGPN